MDNGNDVVLPEMLVAAILEQIGDASTLLCEQFARLGEKKQGLRDAMDEQGLIQCPSLDPVNDKPVFAIDGAHNVVADRAVTYGMSCAVRVGSSQKSSKFAGGPLVLPHLTSVGSVVSGIMFMQEIMLAVKTALEHPEAWVLIDGSKISAIIKINQFYSALKESERLLEQLRDGENHAGQTLREFESLNWFKDYFSSPRIVGVPKMVTTRNFSENFEDICPELIGLDDKTLAALVLEPGEVLQPFCLPHPMPDRDGSNDPFHISSEYPFSDEFGKFSRHFVSLKSEKSLWYLYYCTKQSNTVYKIEYPGVLNSDPVLRKELLSWLEHESPAVDILEPYSLFIAGRFAKESVAIGQLALAEIVKTKSDSPWSWNFTGSYRTD